MKAVYLTAPGTFTVEDVPAPELRSSTDVLLRMQAVGVCGSDLHYFRTGRIGRQVLTEPWIIGHECTAIVEQVGSSATGLTPGARVAIDPLIACGRCDQCRSGRANTCRQQHFLGCPGQQQGCMCELLVMPAACCLPVPEHLSVGAAVMVEPFAIALHAQRLFGDVKGKSFGVLGAGPIGLCVLAALQSAGASSVSVTDKLEHRLSMARRLGATATHDSERPGTTDAILASSPRGLAAVFDCSGEQAALDQSIELLAPGGTLLIVGIPETDRVSLDINSMRRKELVIKNVRRQNDCTADAIELLGSGKVELGSVITHDFELESSQKAFELVSSYRDQVGKALIHFS